MKSNFELWKEGKLSMFIVSFTINGVSGSDSITYSEAEAKEYLSKCCNEFEGTGFEGLLEVRIYNPDLEDRGQHDSEDQIFEDCDYLDVDPYFSEIKKL
jgi:hypothetical protein